MSDGTTLRNFIFSVRAPPPAPPRARVCHAARTSRAARAARRSGL